MAEKIEKILEREYVINLRREFIKVPRYRKAKKSITAIREFITKHMKVEEVKIGPYLNELVMSRGPKHPVPKVKVKTRKMNNYAQVELLDKPYQQTKEEKEVKEKEKEKKKEKKEEKGVMTQEKENKLVKEDKAKEIIKKESKESPKLEKELKKFEDIKEKTKETDEKIRSEKIITSSQKAHRQFKK